MSEALDDLSASFKRHLCAEGKSPATSRLYLRAVTFFGRWLTSSGLDATVDQVTRANIAEWLAALVDEGKAAGTLRTRWMGIHRFCGWLVDEKIIDSQPMAGMRGADGGDEAGPDPVRRRPVRPAACLLRHAVQRPARRGRDPVDQGTYRCRARERIWCTLA